MQYQTFGELIFFGKTNPPPPSFSSWENLLNSIENLRINILSFYDILALLDFISVGDHKPPNPGSRIPPPPGRMFHTFT